MPSYTIFNKRLTMFALPLALLTACGGSGGNGPSLPILPDQSNQPTQPGEPMPPSALLSCDESLKTGFKYDEQTIVLAVKQFVKGDTLSLTTPAPAGALTANSDVCLVKLLVGPGNPGPDGAPSTTKGIGVQIWLPSTMAWDHRLKAVGSGGFIGGLQGDPNVVHTLFGRTEIASGLVHAESGSIGVENDKGHGPDNSGSFAMNPDGTINERGWLDFERANHESVVRAKALSKLFYGSEPKYSYFIGGSSGGREALKLAQKFPTDFNGLISVVPAINWTSFTAAEAYPALVIERDLGGVYPTEEQFSTVEKAALQSCDVVGGIHLGYVLDPSQCNYDPEKDLQVLCAGSGGTNTTPGCVSSVQAKAFNKFWYGPTSDGSVPSPADDNGWALSAGTHRWFGTGRGTYLSLARAPFGIGTSQVALSLQDSTLADPTFINASGNGANRWKSLSYADLSRAIDRGNQLQRPFSDIDTNNPDLSAFQAANGKLIGAAYLADDLIMPGGILQYYEKVVAHSGSLNAAQSFYKLYTVPGGGHSAPVGSSKRDASVPIPTYPEYIQALQSWVEQGQEPSTLVASSKESSPSAPLSTAPVCIYPQKRAYVSGDPFAAESFVCN